MIDIDEKRDVLFARGMQWHMLTEGDGDAILGAFVIDQVEGAVRVEVKIGMNTVHVVGHMEKDEWDTLIDAEIARRHKAIAASDKRKEQERYAKIQDLASRLDDVVCADGSEERRYRCNLFIEAMLSDRT